MSLSSSALVVGNGAVCSMLYFTTGLLKPLSTLLHCQANKLIFLQMCIKKVLKNYSVLKILPSLNFKLNMCSYSLCFISGHAEKVKNVTQHRGLYTSTWLEFLKCKVISDQF